MEPRNPGVTAVLVVGALLAACARPPRAPVERFVTANGVRLQVLDWGGPAHATGLVFIHGLGDSPHAFDDVAPAFNDRWRVIAYGRRAHARSEVKGPYDNATLTEDLRQLLDSLGIRRAVLVGWSLGGTEETGLAIRHPDRVAGLVMLETYDYGDSVLQRLIKRFPLAESPDSADLASPAAFRRWWKLVSTPNEPLTSAEDAEIADLTTRNADGSVRVVTTDSIGAAMYAGATAWHPDFAAVRAPILGIWGHWSGRGLLPDSAPDSLRRKVAAYLRDDGHPFQDSTLAHLRAAQPGARLVMLDSATHAIFPFQNHDTIIAEMRRFLAGVR